MTGREIIKAIMEKVNVSNATLAHRLKIKPTAMWDRLNSSKIKDIPLATLDEMVRALDYKVLIVPSTSKCPKDGFEVESPRTEPRATRKQEVRVSTDVSTDVSTPTTADKADEGEPAKEQAPATLTSIDDVYVPTQEEIDENNRIIEEYNKNRESRGLPKLDFNKHYDLDDFDDDPPVLPEPIDLTPYLISEDDDELPFSL